jgi:hypothetical protein
MSVAGAGSVTGALVALHAAVAITRPRAAAPRSTFSIFDIAKAPRF